jgi:catechol 2,3-dioxygenase-like lactoylglutathione lyase family enzyme
MDNGFNHVGVGVGDIVAAIGFYCEAFGCRVLRQASEVTGEGPEGEEARDVFSSRPLKKMMMAQLAAPDGVGIELFQLIDPPHEHRQPELEYWKSGTFHFCMTALNIDETLSRIIALGGRQISRIWPRVSADPTKSRMVYCTDPWGTVIELRTHPFT